MTVPESYKMDFKTPSGKIELYNPQDVEPLIRYMPPYGDNAPFWLIMVMIFEFWTLASAN